MSPDGDVTADTSWTRARGRVAGLKRHRDADDPVVVAAQTELRAARAEAYIARLVSTAPPLTLEQRRRLAVLLLAEKTPAA